MAAAGCGGTSSPSVASVASTTTTATTPSEETEMRQALAWAACMRAHGVPGLPSPTAEPGGGVHFDVPPSMALSSVYLAASRSCESLQPAPTPPSPSILAGVVKQELAFARCMRSQGVTTFPDPSASGRFELAGSGIDIHSPEVIRAGAKCLRRSGLLPAGVPLPSLP